MEGVPGQSADITNDLIAQKAAEALQKGALGDMVRQTFGAMQSADLRIGQIGQRTEAVAGVVESLEVRVDNAGEQLQQATDKARQQVISTGKEAQDTIAKQEITVRNWLDERSRSLFSHLDDRARFHIGEVKKTADDARTQADRATVEAERAREAQRATEIRLTEAQDILDGVNAEAEEVVIRAIARLRVNPRENPAAASAVSAIEQKAVLTHVHQPLLEVALDAGLNPYLYGGAGTGKTTAARIFAARRGGLLATAKSCSKDMGPHELEGYMSANGEYVTQPFRQVFEDGGVFLLDEMDATEEGATPFNTALANGFHVFPDGALVEKHKDAHIIAGGNTIGLGPTERFPRRYPIDHATRDRFVFIPWELDEGLEEAMACNLPQSTTKPINIADGGIPSRKDWLDTVRAHRSIGKNIGMDFGMRATMNGIALSERGVGYTWLKEMCLYKGAPKKIRDKFATV